MKQDTYMKVMKKLASFHPPAFPLSILLETRQTQETTLDCWQECEGRVTVAFSFLPSSLPCKSYFVFITCRVSVVPLLPTYLPTYLGTTFPPCLSLGGICPVSPSSFNQLTLSAPLIITVSIFVVYGEQPVEVRRIWSREATTWDLSGLGSIHLEK